MRDPDAVDYFASKLRYETDPADLATARAAGEPVVVVDVRDRASWDQGYIPGALHIPRAQLLERAAREIPADADVVVYCWGPGCNGSTKAALELSRPGYQVRALIGGFEYWAREGLQVQTAAGRTRRPVDDLTAPALA